MILSPVQTAVAIVVSLGFIGIVISFVRNQSKFRGYSEVASAARVLASFLKAEITRDGPDLLISGIFQGLPTFVRFSHAERAPAVSITMRSQASFGLNIAPINAQVTDPGGSYIRSGDSRFDERFTIRTDQTTQGRLLLTRITLAHVQKLCCSSRTFFNISPGEMELNEMAVPEPQTASHIQGHIQSMRSLADALQAIPGAENIHIPTIRRERNYVVRLVIAIGVIAAFAMVVSATRPVKTPVLTQSLPSQPADIPPNDAMLIRGLDGWRLATAQDLSPDGIRWLRSNGISVGHFAGDFAGIGEETGVAYLLVNNKHVFRTVVIVNHAVRYDMQFNALAGIARIPKDFAADIRWDGQAAPEIKGDGLLIVTNPQDRGGSIAIFFNEDRLSSAVPADYQDVAVR